MGMKQHFRTSASWDQATTMLDQAFPLVQGSHSTASSYLVYFDHLLVIQADGTSTGLRHPAQFIEAGGVDEAPQSILLEHNGIQVEIEPGRIPTPQDKARPVHRMQLLTNI